MLGLIGFEVGSIKVLSVAQIINKNQELDQMIEKASKLASTDYKKATSDINASIKKLEEEKKTYEDMVTVSSNSDVQTASQIEKYEVEYLWTKIGNHATSEGVTIKMDISKGTESGGSGLYNLNFTVTGSYVGIADFIYAIENDSSLGFKIEEFKMVADGSNLKGTFTCKDVAIKNIQEDTKQNTNTANNTTNTTDAGNSINTTNETSNTTNTTNTNNTDNTTNSAATPR